MPDVEIAGLNTGMDRKQLLLVGGGAFLLVLLIAGRRKQPAAEGGAPAIDFGGAAEFGRVTGEARGDIARLTETQRTLRLQLANEQANTPAGLQTRITAEEWAKLPSGVREEIKRQSRQGKAILSPSGGGFTYTPTGEGLRGHEPLARSRCRRTLLGTKCDNTGPGSVPQAPNPGPSVAEGLGDLYLDYQTGGRRR